MVYGVKLAEVGTFRCYVFAQALSMFLMPLFECSALWVCCVSIFGDCFGFVFYWFRVVCMCITSERLSVITLVEMGWCTLVVGCYDFWLLRIWFKAMCACFLGVLIVFSGYVFACFLINWDALMVGNELVVNKPFECWLLYGLVCVVLLLIHFGGMVVLHSVTFEVYRYVVGLAVNLVVGESVLDLDLGVVIYLGIAATMSMKFGFDAKDYIVVIVRTTVVCTVDSWYLCNYVVEMFLPSEIYVSMLRWGRLVGRLCVYGEFCRLLLVMRHPIVDCVNRYFECLMFRRVVAVRFVINDCMRAEDQFAWYEVVWCICKTFAYLLIGFLKRDCFDCF
eukprot:gene3122-2104_t